MRNGTTGNFSEGEADEVAFYDPALSPGEIKAHHDLALAVAAGPLPPEPTPPAADPPTAGSGPGGGVLARQPSPASPARGSVWVRRGRLTVIGAPGRPNRIVARRKGASWRVSDAAAPLRARAGCRPLTARAVRCRAVGVKSGKDRLTGGARAVFRGGPGVDKVVRRRQP